MSRQFFSVKPLKKISLNEFISSWREFYCGYQITCDEPIKEEKPFPLSKKSEKTSYKKIRKSKTLDIAKLLKETKADFSIFGYSINEEKKEKAKYYDDFRFRGENSIDFSVLETAITPLRDLKIEEPINFTPFNSKIKDSPETKVFKKNDEGKVTKLEELKNTMKRRDDEEKMILGNKETRKNSKKKNSTSSRILKFD